MKKWFVLGLLVAAMGVASLPAVCTKRCKVVNGCTNCCSRTYPGTLVTRFGETHCVICKKGKPENRCEVTIICNENAPDCCSTENDCSGFECECVS